MKYCASYGEGGTPLYETMPGWSARTAGLRAIADLPAAARAYLERLEEACGVPVTMISTGPERDEMIIARHPFG
ncbi:Adenylosuccinate synthetase [compost metagenome]